MEIPNEITVRFPNGTTIIVYPQLGETRWKHVNRKPSLVGERCGTIMSNGYRGITINGRNRLEHRLIFEAVYGSFYEGEIDHINQDKLDNRIANLRLATKSGQQYNVSRKKIASTGIVGVSKCRDKFIARLGKKQRWCHTLEEAIEVRRRMYEGYVPSQFSSGGWPEKPPNIEGQSKQSSRESQSPEASSSPIREEQPPTQGQGPL